MTTENRFSTVIMALTLLCLIGCSNPGKEACARVTSIAEDPRKVEYLREWIEERVSEPGFLAHMGALGLSNAMNDPMHFEQLSLDTEMLGIDKRNAFVWLHGDVDESDAFIKKASLKYAEFGEGRSSLMVPIYVDRGNWAQEIEGFDHVRDGIQFAGEDVVVMCR